MTLETHARKQANRKMKHFQSMQTVKSCQKYSSLFNVLKVRRRRVAGVGRCGACHGSHNLESSVIAKAEASPVALFACALCQPHHKRDGLRVAERAHELPVRVLRPSRSYLKLFPRNRSVPDQL